MFLGTTPAIISQYLLQELKQNCPQRAFVPFAGNFVVEQALGLASKQIQVHSTDISLYSRAIGYALAGTVSEIRLSEHALTMFPGFREFEHSADDIAVFAIFFSDVANAISKQHVKFYQGVVNDAVANHKQYHAKIMSKLQAVKAIIGTDFTFYGSCGYLLCENHCRADDYVFYDPPVLLGDYEKMFAEMSKLFEFKEPAYTEMTDEIKYAQLQRLDEVGCKVMYRTNNPTQNLPDCYKQVFDYRYKAGASYCIYSNFSSTKLFVGKTEPLKETPKPYPIITPATEITSKSKVEIVEVPTTVANHYRLMWVKKAEMKSAGTAYLVVINGVVAGVLQLMSGMTYGHQMCVILSDPAAPSSRYKKLSKLLIMICSTHEMLDMFNEKCMWEHTGFTTRVFTNAQSSMKYRGLFELASKKKVEGNYKWALVYQNKTPLLTYKEALSNWVQKHGQDVHKL